MGFVWADWLCVGTTQGNMSIEVFVRSGPARLGLMLTSAESIRLPCTEGGRDEAVNSMGGSMGKHGMG